jgi:hypothetical protein
MEESLEDRVNKFNALELPGQPKMMHMGTSYLVNDLWREVKQLTERLDVFLHADRPRDN